MGAATASTGGNWWAQGRATSSSQACGTICPNASLHQESWREDAPATSHSCWGRMFSGGSRGSEYILLTSHRHRFLCLFDGKYNWISITALLIFDSTVTLASGKGCRGKTFQAFQHLMWLLHQTDMCNEAFREQTLSFAYAKVISLLVLRNANCGHEVLNLWCTVNNVSCRCG